ncbi:MAG: hypothetical protein COC15_00815 [Legionellales bacterium]|nr:MAG: hypothetical protein COC15_00815 [Legionellales bacterium]
MVIITFSRQLAELYGAGMPIIKALDIIAGNDYKPKFTKIINRIKYDITSGSALHKALRKHPQYFDQLYCNMIAIGEATGKLDIILENISDLKMRNRDLQQKIITASCYPLLVLATAIIVMLILLLKIMPIFNTLFISLNVELPAITKFMLALAATIQQHLIFILLFPGAIYLLCRKLHIDKILLQLPIIGKLLHNLNIATMANTMMLTLQAGMPVMAALQAAISTTSNSIYRTALRTVYHKVNHGTSLASAMRSANLFPNSLIQMITIGENTGAIDKIFANIATLFTNKVKHTTDRFAVLLEPILMLIVGLSVTVLIMAIYLPIFSLGDSL